MNARLAVCLVATVFAAPANATTITWEYDGAVRDVRSDPALVARASSLGIAPGTPVTGAISYVSPLAGTPGVTQDGGLQPSQPPALEQRPGGLHRAYASRSGSEPRRLAALGLLALFAVRFRRARAA